MKGTANYVILLAIALTTACKKDAGQPAESLSMPVIAEDTPPGATNAVLSLRINHLEATGGTSSLQLRASSLPAGGFSRYEGYNYGFEVKLMKIDADGFHVRFKYTNYFEVQSLPLSSNVVFKFIQNTETNLFGWAISGEFRRVN